MVVLLLLGSISAHENIYPGERKSRPVFLKGSKFLLFITTAIFPNLVWKKISPLSLSRG